MFFSEEKNQKTFESPLVPTYPAMAGRHTLAPAQKSLFPPGGPPPFLQKRIRFTSNH
jgi:hypothetical protein